MNMYATIVLPASQADGEGIDFHYGVPKVVLRDEKGNVVGQLKGLISVNVASSAGENSFMDTTIDVAAKVEVDDGR